jgi:sugar lactone lactonase YvrE
MRMTIMLAAIVDTGDLFAATCSANPAKWRIRREPIKKIALVLTTLGLCLAAIHHARASLLYWADQNTQEIARANLDGGEQQVLAMGQLGATGLALDVAAGQIYWTRQGSNGDIRRAYLDGTGQQTLVGQVSAFGIGLDTTRDQMYWTDTGQIDDIRRANLDGTGQQVLVTGQNSPAGIALDITSGKMYWVNQFGGTLLSANLDGTGQQLVLSGLTEPTFPATRSQRLLHRCRLPL